MEVDNIYKTYQQKIETEIKNKETTFYQEVILQHNIFLKNNIINKQNEKYQEYYEKFKLHGPEKTEFIELKLILQYLLKCIRIIEECNKVLNNEMITLQLTSLQCSILSITSEKKYYYGPTIRVIVKILEFIDIFIRLVNPQSNTIAYYHKYRYERYIEYCINLAPNMILFPTFANISATNILNMRSYPIFPIGISITNIYVDEFLQTPVEFFIHDINHSRRMYQENIKSMMLQKIDFDNKDNIFKYYNNSNEFKNNLLKMIKQYDLKNDDEKSKEHISISIEDKINDGKTNINNVVNELCDKEIISNGLKSIIKIIIFEIVHEDALPIEKHIICDTLKRPSGIPVLFPRIQFDDKGKAFIKESTEFGGSILGFVKYKLRYQFFDSLNNIYESIVPLKYRTDKYIHLASLYLLKKICNTDITSEIISMIACNITDKTGLNLPVHKDMLEDKYVKYDYSNEEIKDFREKCKLPQENNFTGNRPNPITENPTLSEILLGGKYINKYINKYIKYKNKYNKLKTNQ
jgi:hypothetical protein